LKKRWREVSEEFRVWGLPAEEGADYEKEYFERGGPGLIKRKGGVGMYLREKPFINKRLTAGSGALP